MLNLLAITLRFGTLPSISGFQSGRVSANHQPVLSLDCHTHMASWGASSMVYGCLIDMLIIFDYS